MVSAPWCLLCGNIYLFDYGNCFTEPQGHLKEGIKCCICFKVYTYFKKGVFSRDMHLGSSPLLGILTPFFPPGVKGGMALTDLQGFRVCSTPVFCQSGGEDFRFRERSGDKML